MAAGPGPAASHPKKRTIGALACRYAVGARSSAIGVHGAPDVTGPVPGIGCPAQPEADRASYSVSRIEPPANLDASYEKRAVAADVIRILPAISCRSAMPLALMVTCELL
jgi:hypothetical protein